MSLFCKHKWIEKFKEVIPSAYEQMKEKPIGENTIPAWAFKRKLILIMVCDLCGKVLEIVEENP